MRPRPRSLLAVAIAGAVMACGASSDPSAGGGAASTLTIYTSVTQDTVDAVEAGFASATIFAS